MAAAKRLQTIYRGFRAKGRGSQLCISRRLFTFPPVLITALVKANGWWNKLVSGEVKSIRDLAEQVGTNERYVAWVLRLKHLATDMIEAILDGRQPPKWTTDTFIKAQKFPYHWYDFGSRC